MGQELQRETYDISINIGCLKFDDNIDWEIDCKDVEHKIKLIDQYQKDMNFSENYLLSELEHKLGCNKYFTIYQKLLYIINIINKKKFRKDIYFK
jgi:hypothetical protein